MSTKLILVEQSELKEMFQQGLQELKQLIEAKESNQSEWICSADVPDYLGVSKRCWQNYRDRKLIPFSQIGRKIWVKRSDLDAFLGKCSVKSSNIL